MQEISLTEARADLTELVNRAQYQGETTIITRHRKAAAMITPVDETQLITRITAETLDTDGWRDRAVTNWLEAAAENGFGFTVIAQPTDGDVLAVVQRDNWDGDDPSQGGTRYELTAEWPEGLAKEDQGTGTAEVTVAAQSPQPIDPTHITQVVAVTSTDSSWATCADMWKLTAEGEGFTAEVIGKDRHDRPLVEHDGEPYVLTRYEDNDDFFVRARAYR